MPGWVWWVLAVVVLLLADRLLLAAEARGWINYRRTPPRKGTAARAVMGVAEAFDPAIHHRIEAEDFDEDRIERSDSGAT
jgi:hypothetical protein